MLADSRSDALVDLFASQWLGLQDVGANPPAADLYPDYDRHLETSMVGESKAFFAEILRRDHSVLNLIASDFVVINERMARHYGIEGVRGDHFRVVAKPNRLQRGGVVTQASILTTTSNGTRTSPVKRGTWIGAEYTNSESIDQIIAAVHEKETRFSSLQLSDMSGTGGAGHSHTLSFNRNGTPIPAENSPRRLFERLFVSDTAEGRETLLKSYADKKSILDSVMQDAKRLDQILGRQDQRKVEEYMESVRQTEARVQRLESWIDVPKQVVDSAGLQLDSKAGDAHDRPAWIDVMLEISYLAFVTDATRVITFEWSREAGGYGGGGENHHELSHHGGDAGMLDRLAQIDRFHLSKLNRFMQFLKSTQDGEDRMLDNTMIMFGSGMNSGEGGDHSPKNLPLLVAGGSKLGLRHGQHLAFDIEKSLPLANVHLTLTQKMGVETENFSDATGTLTGLTQHI